MNAKNSFLLLCITLVILFTSACGPAATPTAISTPSIDPLINTSIAETAQAGVFGTLTQIALSVPTNTPTLQFTETPSQTASPQASPTSLKPMISVTVGTLCRTGPGTNYDRVGELNINTLVEVYAMDPSHSYYFIQNPNQPGTYCWVWGFYATPVNSFVGVPIYTPAYTPTLAISSTPTQTRTATGTVTPVPGFTLSNPRYNSCNKTVDVTITNTGGTVFNSGSIKISNGATLILDGFTQNDFIDWVGCENHFQQGDLAPKEVGTLSSGKLVTDVTGVTLTLDVKLCSADGLGGICSSKQISFKP